MADVIYQATTDNSDRLRYIAGKDAEAIIGIRASPTDEVFMDGINKQFGSHYELHKKAKELCFVLNSLNCSITTNQLV